jgi:hypothetical protein
LFLISLLPLCSKALLSFDEHHIITGKFISHLEQLPKRPPYLTPALCSFIVQDCAAVLKQKAVAPLLQKRLMKIPHFIISGYYDLSPEDQEKQLKILQAFRVFFRTDLSSNQQDLMKSWLKFIKTSSKGIKTKELFSLLLEEGDQLYLVVSPLSDEALKGVLIEKPAGLWVSELQAAYWKTLGEKLFGHIQLSSHLKESHWSSLKHAASYIASKRAYQDIFLDVTNKIAKDDPLQVEAVWACKEQLLSTYSIANSEGQLSQWFALVEQLLSRKTSSSLSLKNLTCILSSSQAFSSLSELVAMLKEAPASQVTQTILYKRISKVLSGPQGNAGKKEIYFADLFDRAFSSNEGLNFLAHFVKVLGNRPLKRRSDSEVAMLNQLIAQAAKLKVYNNKKLVDKLTSHAIEFWPMWLRRERIRSALQLNTDNLAHSGLLDELVRLEKSVGIDTTTKWMNAIKEKVELPIILIGEITKKFSSKQWVLNADIFNHLKTSSVENWKEKLIDHHKDLDNVRKPEELVQLMLIDGIGMNNNIKHLLEDEKENSIVDLIPKIHRKYQDLERQLNDEASLKEYIKKLRSQIKDDISENKETFLQTNKNESWVNFLALLMCAVKKAYDFIPRDTQLVALLAFFDSFKSSNGRLANISTSEGKSLITQMLSVACVLRGEQVDILTSSKELAERDAIDAQGLLHLFAIQVTNNCDMHCDASEQERTRRYAESQVIYGDSGSFQKDLLLTRYFDRDIRKKSGTRLLLDEVDSMLIDNADRTLYISHDLDDFVHLRTLFLTIWHCVNSKDCAVNSKKNREKIEKLVLQKMREKILKTPKTLKKFIRNRLALWIQSAYSARELEVGKSYTFVNKPQYEGRPLIVDLATGVEQANSQWSNGLHQFLQLKHRGKLSKESLRAIYISNLIFFKEYGKNICGMSGTIGLEAEMALLNTTYEVDFFNLPRFKRELE